MSEPLRIPDIAPRIQYVGNGVQTVFIYPFPIFTADQLRVTVGDTPQLAQVTILGAGNSTGGSAVFDHAPASGMLVTLERVLPLQRISDFITGGELSASALNGEFDYLTAALQQVSAAQRAMLHVGANEPAPVTLLPARDIRANKVLGFNEDGAPEMVETAQTYAAPSFSQAGLGAVARTLTHKMRDWVSARDFGAVGDGIADDTAALQNALAAHDTVYLPPGIYRTTATIALADGKTLYGANNATTLKAATTLFDAVALVGSNAALRNMVIDGGETGVRLSGANGPCRRNSLAHLVLRNQAIGVELDGAGDSSRPCEANRLHDLSIENAAVHGVLVTRSGAGAYPAANRLTQIRVTAAALSGHGFNLAAARDGNSLTDCEALLPAGAQSCLHVGGESRNTLVTNFTCGGAVANVLLDAGAQDTMFVNLMVADGAPITDNSGGDYTVLNTIGTDRHRLADRTRIVDLTVEQQRYGANVIAPPAAATISLDISKSLTLVNAAGGAITVQLPKAATGNNGTVVILKKTDATANAVTVTESGGAGPDGRTLLFGAPNDTATLYSDGAGWRILAASNPFCTVQMRAASGIYTPDVSRQLHLVDATSGLTVAQLPPANSAAAAGRLLTIKKTDASANVVRITEEGLFGPDGAVVNLTARYQAVTVLSNGAAWHVVGKV